MEDCLKTYLNLMSEHPEQFENCGDLDIITDVSKIEAFIKETGIQIGVRYESRFNRLLVDLVQNQSGDLFAYERVLPRQSESIVSVILCHGKLVLIKQYRHALRAYQRAFLRGFGEPNISAEENCKKEIREELGVEVTQMQYLGTICPDSGLCGTQSRVFFCYVNEVHITVGYEQIDSVQLVDIEEFEQMCANGEINDSFTLSAYSLWKMQGI